jgi:hypothetical protein
MFYGYRMVPAWYQSAPQSIPRETGGRDIFRMLMMNTNNRIGMVQGSTLEARVSRSSTSLNSLFSETTAYGPGCRAMPLHNC